jgi:hypothetical protein
MSCRPQQNWRERAAAKRWLRSLPDDQLSRLARALTAVDRAVQKFRQKDAA